MNKHSKIEEFPMTVRSYNTLSHLGIRTVGQLSKYTEVEMLSRNNFGRKSLNEIKEILASVGLSLADKPLCRYCRTQLKPHYERTGQGRTLQGYGQLGHSLFCNTQCAIQFAEMAVAAGYHLVHKDRYPGLPYYRRCQMCGRVADSTEDAGNGQSIRVCHRCRDGCEALAKSQNRKADELYGEFLSQL